MSASSITKAVFIATLIAVVSFRPAHGDGLSASEEDRRAAAALNAEGDSAYRAGRFDKALKAYMNAYPNYPNAHAYLMAGDTYWRAVLAAHTPQSLSSAPDSCAITNKFFAEDAQRSLDQHYRPGLSLAAREVKDSKGPTTLRERSIKSAACLTTIQAKYAALPKTACVDLREVSACLGEPLRP
ncbi:tetratricopeptide repeat protein [Roseateles terrae]|uniref:Tetratricopeptide (TPR) repeat protein n=1 Tax=Roseateles terrae TaxID=431060 RepID=A0ABR6GSF3_9BURK|nr:hypothetical protein [Roseateles terrae]MBB3194980.1 tetratricopeptide (TPR) repeat protein [Roseateles terrae]OWQ85779.1 hypothetical protein CDN98_13670 [Roseateles terrae]